MSDPVLIGDVVDEWLAQRRPQEEGPVQEHRANHHQEGNEPMTNFTRPSRQELVLHRNLDLDRKTPLTWRRVRIRTACGDYLDDAHGIVVHDRTEPEYILGPLIYLAPVNDALDIDTARVLLGELKHLIALAEQLRDEGA